MSDRRSNQEPEVDGALVPVTELSSVPMPWLIETSCSRLFTCANWVMYWFGSVGCVGSWFCSSLTSKVRKSFAVISDELLAAALALLDEWTPRRVPRRLHRAPRRQRRGYRLCADAPEVAIELSCDKSIILLLISSSLSLFLFTPVHSTSFRQLNTFHAATFYLPQPPANSHASLPRPASRYSLSGVLSALLAFTPTLRRLPACTVRSRETPWLNYR